ncbi:hypothetical protein DICPUDRAFT_160104 [Dictyostelium purpureum]|uniref:Sugar phosphate transporter domain-containing protein n=1 Tax=Dictyostelium purpureum TaxID=5786 RepID=F1A5Q8_DICPU|nr:uncharacterized protein DICPUDRAFT_160104 [Dictyostelium purpureum]EGC28474.1 hypothetical protein DICPUDRAFT_160104 [Dictyostelium purpureum]|eukprot:XP_003295003.1 hypothetical protein DICPUDRAFT_160104 [Dictyostelium purpureum]
MDIFEDVPLTTQNSQVNNNNKNINNSNSNNNLSPLINEKKNEFDNSTPILLSNNDINLGLNNFQQNFQYLIPNGASSGGSVITSPYIKSSIQNKNSPKILTNNNNNCNNNNTKPIDNFNLYENNQNNKNTIIDNNNLNSNDYNKNETIKLINNIDNILYNNNKNNESKQFYNNDINNNNNNKIKKLINQTISKPLSIFFQVFSSYFDKRHQSPATTTSSATIKNSDLGSAPSGNNKDSLAVSTNNNIEIEFSSEFSNNNSNSINNSNNTTNNNNIKPNIIFYTSYVVILYLIYGFLQELLFKKQEVNFFALYSFSQFFFSFLFSIRDIILQQRRTNKTNNNNNSLNNNINNLSHLQIFQRLSIKKIKLYTLLSFVLFLTKTLGNESLRLLSYKTKILFQTSKIIPVMIIGGILFKRSHTTTEYASIAAMLSGLFLFALGDSVNSFLSPLGIVLIVSYIFVESIKSILYEKILKDFSSELELSLFTNFFGSILTLPILFYSGELKSSLVYLLTHKLVLLSMMGFISLGYFANIAYLNLIKITDAFYANVISSFRKFLTILLSFFLFQDTMLTFHLIGILIFFIGLGTEIRQQKLKDQKLKL